MMLFVPLNETGLDSAKYVITSNSKEDYEVGDVRYALICADINYSAILKMACRYAILSMLHYVKDFLQAV